ncbi:hypothetical protein N9Z27_03060 [Alphaproteobacteria bacterium]|nr:hypothetical protein [Alphaproteobacteria bacterium]
MFGFKKNTKPILWCSKEAEILTGGQNTHAWYATGVAINVNEVLPGDVFFAAHGDDLDTVFKNGAVAAVIPHNMNADEKWPCMRVANTFEALRSFARAGRFKTHALVISVQGENERKTIARDLKGKADIHEGGRHMSQGLAAMPDDVSYGLFGFSPTVAPDIVIITDPEKATYSRVFSAMPAHGVVLMDLSAKAAAPCLAAIKAAGIESVFDIHEILSNSKIVKQKAVRSVLEISANILAKGFTKLQPEHYAALKVRNLIDIGVGNRTIVLNTANRSRDASQDIQQWDLPNRLESLNLVCTSKEVSIASSLHKAVRKARDVDFKKIVPEVLIPGDFVIFKKPASGEKIEFNTALRLTSSRN